MNLDRSNPRGHALPLYGALLVGALLLGNGAAVAKNFGAGAQPQSGYVAAIVPDPPPAALPDNYVNCTSEGATPAETTSASLVELRRCGFIAPAQGGQVLIVATASAGVAAGSTDYEAQFRLAVDGSELVGTDRWVNVATDTGDGTDKNMAVSALVPVGPGFHRVLLNYRRYAGAGTVNLFRNSLQVVLVPNPVATVSACGLSDNLTFPTTSSSFVVARQCTLDLAVDSQVLIVATSSVALESNVATSEYEANFRLSVDSATGLPETDRWVNTYVDGGDGVDESMADTVLATVPAGSHTFSLLVRRQSGSGTVTLYDPTLSVVAIPTASAAACGVSSNLNFTTTSATAVVVRQCSLNSSVPAAALILGSGSVALSDTPFESRFDLAVDDAIRAVSDRWVNVYTDTGDGTDRAMATAVLAPVAAGTRSYSLKASRYSGTGTVLAYDPDLSVLLLPPSIDVTFADGFE